MTVTCDVPPILGPGSSDHQRAARFQLVAIGVTPRLEHLRQEVATIIFPLFPKTHPPKCLKFASSVLEVRKRLHLADTCTSTVYLSAHFQHWGRFIRSRLKDQVWRGLRLFAGELTSSQTWIAAWHRCCSLGSYAYDGKLHADRTTKSPFLLW